jgi:hypothetical protein
MVLNRVESINFSAIAFFIGIITFGASLAHFWYGPIQKQEKVALEEKVVEMSVEVIKRLDNKNRFFSKEEEKTEPVVEVKPSIKWDVVFIKTAIGISIFVMLLSIIGFVKRESTRLSIVSFVLGLSTMGFYLFLSFMFYFIGLASVAMILYIIHNYVINLFGLFSD